MVEESRACCSQCGQIGCQWRYTQFQLGQQGCVNPALPLDYWDSNPIPLDKIQLGNFPTPFLVWSLLRSESGQTLRPGFQRAHDSILTTMTLFLILSPPLPKSYYCQRLDTKKLHSAKFQRGSALLFSSQRLLGEHGFEQQSWTRRHPPAVGSKVTTYYTSVTRVLGWTERGKGSGHRQQDVTSRLECLESGPVETSLRRQVVFTVRRSAGVLLLSTRNTGFLGTHYTLDMTRQSSPPQVPFPG